MTTKYQHDPHPLAMVFPLASDEDYERLKKNLASEGQQERIVLLDKKILDGRNRERGVIELEKEPLYIDWEDTPEAKAGMTPLRFVVLKNFARRHLTPSQKAMAALNLTPLFQEEARERQFGGLKKGVLPGKSPLPPTGGKTHLDHGKVADSVAALVGASGRSVERAKRIVKTDKNLAKQIFDEGISLRAAEDAAKKKEPKVAGWSEEAVAKDKELHAALAIIAGILGQDRAKSVRLGHVGGRAHVIFLSKLTPSKMREVAALATQTWSPKGVLKFLDKKLDGESRIADLQNRCIANQGRYEIIIVGFKLTCEKLKK